MTAGRPRHTAAALRRTYRHRKSTISAGSASLSALDIAVIQDKYGVNEEWATGNNVYTLKDVNAPGTFYSLHLGRRRHR